MGSTGGTMAAAVVILGIIKGIERPAIGGPIVGAAPHQTILDLGSNIDCKPSQLLGFGVLGSVFGNVLLKIEDLGNENIFMIMQKYAAMIYQ